MLNPSVGEMVEMSSPLILFKIVVFPALSNPLSLHLLEHFSINTMNEFYSIRILVSFSLALSFFKMVSNPIFVLFAPKENV